MINQDEAKKLKRIRFEQRFSNFEKAYMRLMEFLKEDTEHDVVSRTALVHAFEFTFELSWKAMKDLLELKDGIEVSGPSTVLQEAYEQKYFKDTGIWAAALYMRNNASHIYNEEVAVEVEKFIRVQFKPLVSDLYGFFQKIFMNQEDRTINEFGLEADHLDFIVQAVGNYGGITEARIFEFSCCGNYKRTHRI